MHFDQINAALMRIKDNIKQTDPKPLNGGLYIL